MGLFQSKDSEINQDAGQTSPSCQEETVPAMRVTHMHNQRLSNDAESKKKENKTSKFMHAAQY